MDVLDEYSQIHQDDLWVYNKLILSRKLGYLCGPAGSPVPHSDFFIVRPVMNFMGMGRFARVESIENSTEHLHPGEFWCEIFQGDHISVDFYQKQCVLTVQGFRDSGNSLYMWNKWKKIDREIEFPPILNNLIDNYEWINCEFIGDKLIEVHFRQNPDFLYGNSIAIPVWDHKILELQNKYKYVQDEDYLRKGFYID